MLTKQPQAPRKRISEQQEAEILRLTGDGTTGSHVIALLGGVSQTTVLRVWRRHRIDREKLAARNKLVEDHRTLAVRVARSVASRLPEHMREELPLVAHMALVEAAERYDPSYNVPFSLYMQQRVRGACIDSVRRRHYTNANADEYEPEANESRHDGAVSVEEALIESEQHAAKKAIAVDAIGRLPGRLAVLVWLHYIEGQTLETIAPKFGVVSSRVSQLHREALLALKSAGKSAEATVMSTKKVAARTREIDPRRGFGLSPITKEGSPEPLSAETKAAIDEGLDDIAKGRTTPLDEYKSTRGL